MAKCIVILGMHRSATSLIAKGLVSNRVYMGSYYLKRDENNPLGYYEDIDFCTLNRKILKAAGGDWRNIPSKEKILALKNTKFMYNIEQLVKKKQAMNKIWGWKDPRTILTIELYEPFLKEVIYVPCFRNPMHVAKSLNVAHNISIQEGTALAVEYNRRLLNFLNERFLS